jgi:hypothetical protein
MGDPEYNPMTRTEAKQEYWESIYYKEDEGPEVNEESNKTF